MREIKRTYIRLCSTEKANIAIVVEKDPDNVLKNLHKNVSTLITDFHSYYPECILATKGSKDLVMIYDSKKDITLTYWNNQIIFDKLLTMLKPLIERVY